MFENFKKFVPIVNNTGVDLYLTLINTLKDLKLEVDDIWVQGYDNGINIKGTHLVPKLVC